MSTPKVLPVVLASPGFPVVNVCIAVDNVTNGEVPFFLNPKILQGIVVLPVPEGVKLALDAFISTIHARLLFIATVAALLMVVPLERIDTPLKVVEALAPAVKLTTITVFTVICPVVVGVKVYCANNDEGNTITNIINRIFFMAVSL
jgi:hypothetical protein